MFRPNPWNFSAAAPSSGAGGSDPAEGFIGDGDTVTVANYAALPSAAANSGKLAWVLADSGTLWTKKYAGWYVSDGATWSPATLPDDQYVVTAALQTDVDAADTTLLQAYDVDGAAYTTFATLTAGNTPTFDLSTATTIGTNNIVASPGSVTDNAIVRYDGTTGKLVQNSGVTIDDSGNISTSGKITATVLQTQFIPAASIRPSASGGCAALALTATTANRPDLSYLAFDSSTAEYAQFWVALPKGWNESTVTAVFYWTHPSTATNFGVRWGLQGVAVSNDDTMDAAYGTAQEVTDTGGTTSDLYVSDATSAITIGGTPAEGDMVCFRVYRDPANGGDTMAVDAYLLGVKLLYTINTLDDT